MNVIKSLYIEFVELYVDANFIINLFYTSNIATVSRITFQQDDKPYKRAYVDIYEWHDTENAYNFMKRLQNPNVETKLIHIDDDWWVVKINTKREEFYIHSQNTTIVNYLIQDIDLNQDLQDQEIDIQDKNLIKDKEQDLQDWREIDNLLNTSLICFRLELSY